MNRGANRASNARLDISDRSFWERQRTAFFDVRVCHHNADSYRDLSLHEKSRLMEVEQGTFTPLDFTTTDGMAEECKRYHNRLAELLAVKKGEDYPITVSWLRAKVSFAILRSALLCLRGFRGRRRNIDLQHTDIRI